MYTNASQTHHLIALAEFSNSTRFGFRAVERRDRSCSCRGAHVCAPLQAPPNLTIDRTVFEMWLVLSGSPNPATGQS